MRAGNDAYQSRTSCSGLSAKEAASHLKYECKNKVACKRLLSWITVLLTGSVLAGCLTTLEKQLEGAISNVDDVTGRMLSHACEGTVKVSDDANEVLRLKSSEDLTLFYVDGIQLTSYPVKQLKVCIDSKTNHTIVAEPEGCDSKTEKLEPPYDKPIYEFQFMLGDCK